MIDATWNSGTFWTRLGEKACPRFDGKSVLEIGCGEGGRCIEAAQHGAMRVLGIDTLETQIETARESLANSSMRGASHLEFKCSSIEALPDEQFDVIVSESALEHVMNVPALLAEVRRRLKPAGRFYLCFGPLYHAPEGDHGWLRAVLPGRRYFPWPWGHLLFRNFALRRLSTLHGAPIANTHNWPYLDLNELSLSEYVTMLRECGLRIVYERTNVVSSMKARIFAALGRLPVVSKYFAINMYVVLERS
jgi:cyclopropane fatty-acyl-phospholipid synthase-like methyltransferase